MKHLVFGLIGLLEKQIIKSLPNPTSDSKSHILILTVTGYLQYQPHLYLLMAHSISGGRVLRSTDGRQLPRNS